MGMNRWILALGIFVGLDVNIGQLGAHGDVAGFGDFSDFTIRKRDSGAYPITDSKTQTIQLTNQGFHEARSIYHNVPQPVGEFEVRFRYRAEGAAPLNGACFVLQNDPRGLEAFGESAGSYGYGCELSSPENCVTNSIAVTLELEATLPTRSGVFADGQLGGGAPPSTPVDLGGGSEIEFIIRYDGGTSLEVEITDVNSGDTTILTHQMSQTIPVTVNGDTAYVGFTGSTSGGLRSNQFFSAFQFSGLSGSVDSDGDGVPDIYDDCSNSLTGLLVDPSGRPLGDVDTDCDVDLADFAIISGNFTGPE